MFRLTSISRNHFTPCHVFGCAWKIWSNGKTFPLTVKRTHFSRKINCTLILPLNNFQDSQREREREERAQGSETHLPSAPPHAPRERRNSTPYVDASLRSPTLRRAVSPYPIHSTSPLPTLSSACTRSNKENISLMPAKPISPPTSLICRSHVGGETLLSNLPSTIPDPPKTDLDLDQPKTDLIVAAKDHCRS